MPCLKFKEYIGICNESFHSEFSISALDRTFLLRGKMNKPNSLWLCYFVTMGDVLSKVETLQKSINSNYLEFSLSGQVFRVLLREESQVTVATRYRHSSCVPRLSVLITILLLR